MGKRTQGVSGGIVRLNIQRKREEIGRVQGCVGSAGDIVNE